MAKGQQLGGNRRRYRKPHGRPQEELDEEGNVVKRRGLPHRPRTDLRQERQWERNPEQED